jgi:glycosyltransferase involved in cell wall biosynthesis
LLPLFQNIENQRFFVAEGVVREDQTVVIRGVGVDVRTFVPRPKPPGSPVLMLASRLLWDEGVGDFVEAVRLLKRDGVVCRAVIVGKPDTENPHALPLEVLGQWEAEGVIELWGHETDMPTVLGQAAVVVLPTFYPKGLPKILLEATASACPIVATDVPGCRGVVRHGENGLLVPPHNPPALAAALVELLRHPQRRAAMGALGRARAEQDFSEEQVCAETLQVDRDLLGG